MTRLVPFAKVVQEDYETALRSFRLEFSRAGAWTGIALVLLGSGLDHAAYPEWEVPFAAARITVSLFIFGILRLMRTAVGRQNIQWLTFSWLLLPQIMISWMIGLTEGASSIYYSGLTLAIYSSGIVLAFGLWQNIVFGAVSYLMYFLACARHPESFGFHGPFGVNSLFIVMSATVSAVFTVYNERARKVLFQLKAEVAKKNVELELTNSNLAEIKGQMLQQEKMAAIGTLASGLMHEVNNPVNFCLMAIELAAEQPVAKADPLISECLVDAKGGMQRVQHIVSDLKTLAYRKNGTDLLSTYFLFERALGSALRLANHELRHVKVTRNLPADTLVRGDEAAIIGVLINLFSNAVMAMLKAGKEPCEVDITAQWVMVDHSQRLRVTVRDNGPGIEPANLPRVFEPFFTTRDVGQGLGLGLSISYRVIERHGGVLTAESAVGEWTKMIFDLPRAEVERR
ncbi:sensor histidine kinase [Duganella vulcania]|uniref:histidine kinase n=1 Tax=Duganella vulcania TaxID=2692166 RepID=A0A845GHE5_9BURK|nr:HAMP domain-containing sensor histidine kinase [Duganella vulcania]MYM92825.1 two-component sensor histidine kinase [Duganella vulcania]